MLPETPPASVSTQPQTWAAIATAIAGALGMLIKKRFTRARAPTVTAKSITHTELQQGLDTMRDRITAGYLALAEKIDTNHKDVVTAIAQHGSAIEQRLDALESAVARLDERTKK